jgi:hypothetical protein
VPEEMFKGCQSLESVKFEAGIKDFNREAFRECTSLKAIYVPADAVEFTKRCFKSWNRMISEEVVQAILEK